MSWANYLMLIRVTGLCPPPCPLIWSLFSYLRRRMDASSKKIIGDHLVGIISPPHMDE